MRQVRRLGAAVLLGLAIWLAVDALSPAPPPDTAVTSVRDLPAGHTLTASDLTTAHVPAELLPGDAVRQPEPAAGRRLARAVGPREILTDRSLVVAREVSATQRAVHVPVPDPGALLFLRAGDRLDLVEGGRGRTVARDVRVLAVDDPAAEKGGHGLLLAVDEAHLSALIPAMTEAGPGLTPVLRTS